MEEEKKNNWAIWLILPICALTAILLTKWFLSSNSGSHAGLTEEYSAEEIPVTDEASGFEESSEPTQNEAKRTESEPNMAQTRPATRSAAAQVRGDETSAKKLTEAEFLRKHGREIKKYQAYLYRLGLKYKAQYPALRKLNADFSKMDRYMALKKQYDKDKDAYKWARGTIALPEVRNKLIRASADPEVVKGILSVSLEAMRNPPPDAIYNEVMNFLCADKQASPYVDAMSMTVVSNMASSLPSAITPGMDLTPLQKIGEQISAGRTH
ncbi:MAG: hypothetical protein WCK75_00115 [Elusimicrobiota bacterium]